jgi:hypothetical protein
MHISTKNGVKSIAGAEATTAEASLNRATTSLTRLNIATQITNIIPCEQESGRRRIREGETVKFRRDNIFIRQIDASINSRRLRTTSAWYQTYTKLTQNIETPTARAKYVVWLSDDVDEESAAVVVCWL